MTMGSVHHNYNLQCCFQARNGHSLIENHQLQGRHIAKYCNMTFKKIQRDWHFNYNYVPFNLKCNISYFAGRSY